MSNTIFGLLCAAGLVSFICWAAFAIIKAPHTYEKDRDGEHMRHKSGQ